ncbi:hypothetical protein HELRODRAFT_188977 [Helobdella robusta]|uniref:BHLH domain-containing protein n=1 Tax=Helobdella robusta TaxID=6412 RepID=T1FQI9_HELRO|nr:hypothetical protein HELRODRAFT_188977 [Helobdella robusta]ESN99010.1 hypothetical protein HELRODRAFT_188977 [Helobdella robusta]
MGRKRRRDNMEDSDDSDEQMTSSSTSPDDDNDAKPIQERNAANERERARMRVLSRAFHRLKTSLPWVPPDTKLSKLDTLRLASCYIAHLSRMLADDGDANAAATVKALVTSEHASELVRGVVGSYSLDDINLKSSTKLKNNIAPNNI